jgi:hypothetical protein
MSVHEQRLCRFPPPQQQDPEPMGSAVQEAWPKKMFILAFLLIGTVAYAASLIIPQLLN